MSTKIAPPPTVPAPMTDFWAGAAHPSVRPQPPILERAPTNWFLLVKEARAIVAGRAAQKLCASPSATVSKDIDRLVLEMWNEDRGTMVDAERGITLDACISRVELGSNPLEFLRGVFSQLFRMRASLPQLRQHHAALGELIRRFAALESSS